MAEKKIDTDFLLKNKDKYTTAEFARMFNCSRQAVHQYINFHDIKVRKKFISESDKKRFAEDLSNGMRPKELSKKYGMKSPYSTATRMGLSVKRVVIPKEKLKHMIESDPECTIQKIADEFSTDRRTVYRYIKKYDLTYKPKWGLGLKKWHMRKR